MHWGRERLLRSTRSDESGFTLVELVVAMFLTLIVMAALLAVLVSSLKTVTQARQRQTATALATQEMEQLRALPYATVTGPAPVAFPKSSGLQYVTTSGSVDTFAPAASIVSGVSEELVVNEYSGKRTTTTVSGMRYTVQKYVTKRPGAVGSQQAYNLSVLVNWTGANDNHLFTVAQRSTLFSPSACLSSAQHPFSGPCQAFFTVQAGLVSGGVHITNPLDGTQDVQGFDSPAIGMDLARLSTSLLIEQTATATGNVASTRSVLGAPATSTKGGTPAVAAVDSDPSSTPNQSSTQSTGTQAAGALTTTGPAGSLRVNTGSGDTGASRAAISADTTTCKDGDTAGTALTTGPTGALRPCASSNITAAAANSMSYVTPLGSELKLVRFDATSTPWRAVSALLGSSSPGACPTTVGAAGCAHASASRSLSGFRLFDQVGAGTPWGPSGSGLVSLTSMSEQVVAEQGVGAITAPTYVRAGSLKIWNGTGYTTVDLSGYQAPSGSSLVVAVPDTALTIGEASVHVLGSVSVNRPAATISAPAGCADASCVQGMNGGGGVRADLRVTVTIGGATVSDFLMAVDLGGLSAQSTYKAAPLG